MNYEKKYKEALEIARKINSGEGVAAPSGWSVCETIFPELKENDDERIRKEILSYFTSQDIANQYVNDKRRNRWLAWLEKQGNDPTYNEEKPNGGIVLEDFNEGDGFYKVNLAYLNKEQIEEIETIVKKWNSEPVESDDEKVRRWFINWVNQIDWSKVSSITKEQALAWFEKRGKKHTWSENDEKVINDIMWIIEAYRKNGFNETHIQMADDSENWLKTLEERLK